MRITAFVILLTVLQCFFGCRSDDKVENKNSAENYKTTDDTVEVTKFSLEREYSGDLSDWKSYEINQATIYLPPKWVTKIEGQTFIAKSDNGREPENVLQFTFYAIDTPNLDYDDFAKKLNAKAFANYSILAENKLKKVELEKNIYYERNIELIKSGKRCKSRFLIYATDNCVYEYTITISLEDTMNYKGNLMQDITGNFQVDKEYFFGDHNKFKRIINLE